MNCEADKDRDSDDYINTEWADPKIKEEYEAALGRIILSHNRIDSYITKIIEKILDKLGNPKSLKNLKKGTFATRLNNLEILMSATAIKNISGINISKIREVNEKRNIFAHGHFDQNPFDGSYKIVTQKTILNEMNIETMHNLNNEMIYLGDHLNSNFIFFDIAFQLNDNTHPHNV